MACLTRAPVLVCVARGLLAALLWFGVLSAAQAQGPAVLAQDAWLEAGESATIEQVAARKVGSFTAAGPSTIYPLGPGKTLWLRLRLQSPAGAATEWGLDIPVPLLDYAAVYQRGDDARWTSQVAGDNIAVAAWSRPGRYPGFDLALPAAQPRDVYVQVRHSDPIGFALRVAPGASLDQARQVEYFVLGMLLGTLLLLAVSCLIQAGLHRDLTYAWYALYAAAMTLTMATLTGVAAHLLWDQSPAWSDLAQGVLPVWMAGVNILFLRHLCGLGTRYPRLDRATLVVGLAVLAMGALLFILEGWVENVIVALGLVAGLVLTFTLAVVAWRRKDVVGRWVLLAYAPLAVTVAVAVLRMFGLVAASWLTLDASVAASAMAVPLLLVALNARSRDRHGAQTRVNQLTQQDALTGLLSSLAFERQLKAAVSGALMRREAAAVVVVEVVNLQQIRKFYGDAMAEQCLLRAVIKLHRVVRDSDPAGRIDTARFGIIFEGMRSREDLQQRMVRLVASGLVPPRGARLQVPLQFHVACLLLGEKVLTPQLILRELNQLLASMSRRTRRPVRFLEPQDSAAQLPSQPPSEAPQTQPSEPAAGTIAANDSAPQPNEGRAT